MLRVPVAGIPGAWSSERMCEALRSQGMESFVFDLGDCLHDLSGRKVTLEGRDLSEFNGIVVKKLASQEDPAARLRLHLLRELEAAGVRIFSAANVIERVMDRYWMNMTMVSAGLPLPPTFSLEVPSGLMEAVNTLGTAVVKPIYTSKGRGMFKVETGSPLEGWQDGHGRWLAQSFVRSPGRDIGACVLGGEFIGAFYRVAADGDWMTTTARGGRYAPCELSQEGQEIAVRAAKVFGLDYTIADLVETDDGFRMYEVSAFGGFRGLWDASGRDVAVDYATYTKKELSQ
jgi:ribosomal protein S6--L-glutamate ligase